MAKQWLAIVRGQRLANQSARGQPAYARLKGLMNYIAYGRYEDHLDQTTTQRGLWLDHHGKPVSHESALHWARDKVHQYGYEYTYQLLLSTRYGGLIAGDFNHVLQQGSHLSGVREWRLMVHEDTGNQHAHAILLRQEKLSNSLYKEWQQGMQVELERLQAERYQERHLETEITPSIDSGQVLERAPEAAAPEAAQPEAAWPEAAQHQAWEMEQ